MPVKHNAPHGWRRMAPLLTLIGACVLSGCMQSRSGASQPTGDLELSYAMPQANGEQIPYHVFLPSGWNAHRKWPLVVVLHGYANDANSMFKDAGGALQAEAEKHGFVVVSPNGYNGMADYGANLPLPSGLSRFGKPLTMSPEAELALAEADVINVISRTEKDYHIDPRRIYLMGNSMGMTGVLHLASKLPQRWCAISPSDGPPWHDYPVERLNPIAGVLFVHGENDDIAKPADTRLLYDKARAAGINAQMALVPGGTHGNAWVKHLPQTFQFFAETNCDAG